MNSSTINKIKDRIETMMDGVIEKRVKKEPFNEESIKISNPFGYRLVPIEVWKGSKFERSFVTTLGQGIFEQLGKIIAEGTGAIAHNQYDKQIKVNTFISEKIDDIIKNQRSKQKKFKTTPKPNLHKELELLSSYDIGSYVELTIKSDLYIKRPNGLEEYYSFKTVKPNLDQTAEAKKNLLLLKSSHPCEAYFGLPFNPAGEGNRYEKIKHTFPSKLFDMTDTNFVLIGSSLWNKIGNSPDTYNLLIEIFDEVGQKTSNKIRHKYFDF